MKYKWALSFCLSLASCSFESIDTMPSPLLPEEINGKDALCGIISTVSGIEFEEDIITRTTLTPSNQGISFSWNSDDMIGVFGGETDLLNYQIKAIGDCPNTASFKSDGFGLVTGQKYYAFNPCPSRAEKRSSVVVNYKGQVQEENGGTSHLGRYDYMISSSTAFSSDSAVFIFSHLNSILYFRFLLPVGIYTNVTLTSLDEEFISSGTVDLTADNPVITSTSRSKSFSLALGKEQGIEINSEDRELAVYLSLAPIDLSSKTFSVKVQSLSGAAYYASFRGKNMVAGKGYAYFCKPSKQCSFYAATDRHELRDVFRSLLAKSCSFDGVPSPNLFIMGGDNVCSPETGMMPAFSMTEVKEDIYSVFGSDYKLLATYATHDNGCIDNYLETFYSGPQEQDGYYTYGITSSQMNQSTKDLLEDKIINNQLQDYLYDPYGYTATEASAFFTNWVNTLTDNKPIIIMSHLPMHYRRLDNHGGDIWYKAISEAAKKQDIVFLWGHNHSGETTLDTDCYLLAPGDKIKIQTHSNQNSYTLNFYYVNAGYVKHGSSSIFTFIDDDEDDCFDSLIIRKFDENGRYSWGSELKSNDPIPFPYTIKLR